MRLEDDLLIVACDDKPRVGLKAYGLRWGSDHARRCILWSRIETFFGNSKTRGFHFEDTHLTQKKKLSLLMGMIALATLWALRVGEALEVSKGVLRRKSHGRLAESLFRVGLDFLRGLIFDGLLGRRENQMVFRVMTCT